MSNFRQRAKQLAKELQEDFRCREHILMVSYPQLVEELLEKLGIMDETLEYILSWYDQENDDLKLGEVVLAGEVDKKKLGIEIYCYPNWPLTTKEQVDYLSQFTDLQIDLDSYTYYPEVYIIEVN